MKTYSPFILLFILLFSCSASRGVTFPAQVPYLGPEEDYFLGNGITGAIGTTDGSLSALLGPNYTSPNFIKDETIYMTVDGETVKLSPKMHRARATGDFYGKVEISGMTVILADYTNFNQNWVARYINVVNNTAQPHAVTFRAAVTPGSSVASVVDGQAVCLYADTTQWNFDTMNLESKNWADRYSMITFTAPCRARQGDVMTVETSKITVPKHGTYNTALYHDMYYDNQSISPAQRVSVIKARNPERDFGQSVSDWKAWLASGQMHNKDVNNAKARDVIEGSLLVVKMLQDTSGGFIAGLREYPHSYVRDSHGAARLLSATHHNAEVKKLIQNIVYKTKTFGHIPNAWQMGADKWHLYRFNNPNAESPAYCLMLLRYYLQNTGDYSFAREIFPFIQHAVDVQVNDMKHNGWKIDFNGDETERYTVRTDGETYGILSDWASDATCRYWSLPSTVAALASVKFFTDLCKKIGKDDVAERYAGYPALILKSIDDTFWRNDLGYHDWCRKRDGGWAEHRIPNYMLIPLWLGVELNGNREVVDALATKQFVNRQNGYLPTAPGDVEGFSGHNLGYLLYDMKKLGDPMADTVFHTLMTQPIISCWGSVSEFYGPGCVPNGHLMNAFSTGIVGEAVLRYFTGFEKKRPGK